MCSEHRIDRIDVQTEMLFIHGLGIHSHLPKAEPKEVQVMPEIFFYEDALQSRLCADFRRNFCEHHDGYGKDCGYSRHSRFHRLPRRRRKNIGMIFPLQYKEKPRW